MKKTLWILALSLILNGCGWHLRGSLGDTGNIDALYLSAASVDRAFISTLEKRLAQQGISQLNQPEAGKLRLTLDHYDYSRRTLTVGSDALAAEYELNLSVSYSLYRDETVLLSNAKAQSLRTYDFDSNQILGKSNEEAQLKEQMQQELVQQILRRINFVSAP